METEIRYRLKAARRILREGDISEPWEIARALDYLIDAVELLARERDAYQPLSGESTYRGPG